MFCLQDTAIDSRSLIDSLRDSRGGALVTFEGWVRNHNDGRQVTMLEYEAYGELAKKEAERILQEAIQRFSILNARCVHRIGTLAVADMAVWVGVTSVHRDEAFQACRYIIDEVKKRVPIWKKEHYIDGSSSWVNCAACATDGAPSHVH